MARTGTCLLAALALNGCAALAVSLAGAGAGAGFSHQMNGTATRTFSEPLEKVDTASRVAARKMSLQVDTVASTENGQITRSRISNLDVTVELETLSPNLTRVSVVARKDLLRVDGATAQEIVVQIERALGVIQQAELAEAQAQRARLNDARFLVPDAALNGRKSSGPAKRKNAI